MSLEIETSQGNYCTDFTYGEDYEPGDSAPCKCPHCGGWLTRDFPSTEGEQWQCRKCGSVLEIIINTDPEEESYYLEQFENGILYQLGLEQIPPFDITDTGYFSGKICVVPSSLVKMETIDYVALRKERGPPRKNMNRKVFMGNILRTVWKDKDGEYIEIGDMRISADDPRLTAIKELPK